jgi:xanthine dehydrogenase YagR molybdenum-binding subunit
LEFRLRNDSHPVRQVQWRVGAEKIGWEENRRKEPGSDPGPVKRGVGCAAGFWFQKGGGRWRVDVQVARDGTVVVSNAAQDLGTGTRTVLAVMVAEELGIPPSRITVRLGDTDLPAGPGSGGSQTAPSLGPAAREAGLRARERLVELLAADWGVAAGEVALGDGVFTGPGKRKATFEQACGLIGADGVSVTGQRRDNYDGFDGNTAGCQFAQVAVDVETGVVRVERIVAVHDSGRIIDALTARSQVIGGVIQGVSYALYEERQLDQAMGDMVNPRLDTYRITGMRDCPRIEAVLTRLDSGFNNAGMMGLGEPVTVPTAGAVANAVANATGVRMTEIPLTPARVLAALGRGR